MGGGQGLLDVLDTRSFSSIWYWLMLTLLWTWVGRGALGIPSDLVAAVRRHTPKAGTVAPQVAPDQHMAVPELTAGPARESLLLLDWLSLVLPRWRLDTRDGVVLLALAAFGLTLLAGLGFVHGRQTGQALFLLLAPLTLLLGLRLRLAVALTKVLSRAEAGQTAPDAAAAEAARLIRTHMRVTLALSVVAVGAATLWGTHWLATHPNWM